MKPPSHSKVGVVGASIGGLAAANVFFKLGYTVTVYERSKHTFQDRGSSLGFVDVQLWQRLTGRPMMRRGRPASRRQGAFFYGDLWQFLYEGLPDGAVKLGHAVHSLGQDVSRPSIEGEEYDLLVVADGGWSGLRQCVTGGQPEYAGYVIFRGNIPWAEVPWFGAFGNHSSGLYDTLVFNQARSGEQSDRVSCGVFVPTPEAEVVRPGVGVSRHGVEGQKAASHRSWPAWFLPFYRQHFGRVEGGQLARLFEAVAANGTLKTHPQYEFGADRVTRGRVVVVGDAAHMASPRTGAGAHTAVLDAAGLRNAFSTAAPGDIDTALQLYGPTGLERARSLWMRSRRISRQMLPPGGVASVASPASLVHSPMDVNVHADTASVFGYGSLMDLKSAARSMPSATNLRYAVLSGYTRRFDVPSIGATRNDDAGTKETAMLSIHPSGDAADEVYGVVFDIPAAEVAGYFRREFPYRRAHVTVALAAERRVRVGCLAVVAHASDGDMYDYIAAEDGQAQADRVRSWYGGIQAWGCRDVLPRRDYLARCFHAAKCGGDACLANFLETSLADGRLLREYLAPNEDV
eukprot:g3001.t1